MLSYMSTDEAVEGKWNMKFKPGYGRYNSDVKEGDDVVYRGFDTKPRAVHRPFTDVDKYTEAVWLDPPGMIQVAEDVANYIYDTIWTLS